MAGKTIEVQDQNFDQEVLKSETPVLVDFWAPWCGPCLAVAPTLEDIAGEYEGKLKIAKLNVDENANSPVTYGVRGIPCMILFKEGKVVETLVGNQPKDSITKAIDGVI